MRKIINEIAFSKKKTQTLPTLVFSFNNLDLQNKNLTFLTL
jgi:hypothetical protein